MKLYTKSHEFDCDYVSISFDDELIFRIGSIPLKEIMNVVSDAEEMKTVRVLDRGETYTLVGYTECIIVNRLRKGSYSITMIKGE